jgi:hypothetical protein
MPEQSPGTALGRPTEQQQRIARITGVLWILTFVTSITAYLLYDSVLDDTGFITGTGSEAKVLVGAFLELVLIIANIGTATYLWPVLKRQHESLAMSYVAARIMESVFIAVGVLSVLTVVTLRQSHAGADAGAAAGLTVTGDAFLRLQEWTFGLGPSFVVGVGNGVILGYLMYRSRLVPRGLAVLGLVGGPLIILSGAAAMVGIIELDGTWQILSAIPEFFWELGLGIYLVVKGFKPSPVTAGMDDER